MVDEIRKQAYNSYCVVKVRKKERYLKCRGRGFERALKGRALVKITYVEHDGTKHDVDAPEDRSLMEVAVDNMVPGIDGDCGGACACATCHVYVDDAWVSKTGERSEMESSMLEFAEAVEANSRLACQIKTSAGIDGVIVRLPESQH
jgi:ferredoxin, 2Fe-2S